jgi:hypothetical protein
MRGFISVEIRHEATVHVNIDCIMYYRKVEHEEDVKCEITLINGEVLKTMYEWGVIKSMIKQAS